MGSKFDPDRASTWLREKHIGRSTGCDSGGRFIRR
jgi:hypothetical protein